MPTTHRIVYYRPGAREGPLRFDSGTPNLLFLKFDRLMGSNAQAPRSAPKVQLLAHTDLCAWPEGGILVGRLFRVPARTLELVMVVPAQSNWLR
ncbi:MAG: hypothetical protein DMG96_10310 [Acidobacteria bacterium]|nr:MAG: hypothetical protein DMG96_10310 [Acidobacteriota bacterium]